MRNNVQEKEVQEECHEKEEAILIGLSAISRRMHGNKQCFCIGGLVAHFYILYP